MDGAASGLGVETVDGSVVCQTTVDSWDGVILRDSVHCQNQLGDSSWSATSCEINPLAGKICTCVSPLSMCATKGILPFYGGSVKIDGKNEVGEMLKAVVTDTTPKGNYSYLWFSSNDSTGSSKTLLTNANGSTLVVTSNLEGKYIFVSVSAKLDGYYTTSFEDYTDSTNNGSGKVENNIVQTYTVTFDPNGGTLQLGDSEKTVTSGSEYGTLPTPIKGGYYFLGWFTEKLGGTKIRERDKVTSNQTLYAQWKLPTITATFKNGLQVIEEKTCALSGATCSVTVPTNPTKTGYTFKGWGTSSTCISGNTNSSININQDTTYYACWDVNTYMVNFDPNGGTVQLTNKLVTYNSIYDELPPPSKGTYQFLGWFTAASGGTKITESSTVTIASNHTLYAHWGKNNIQVTRPTESSHCKSGLVYNEKNQTLTNAADTGYTFSNNKRTNAGSQTVKATLSSGYVWSDNTTGVQTFSCSIAKATPTITVSKTSLSVEKGKTNTFTIEGTVVGDYTISNASTSIATVNMSKKDNLEENEKQTIIVTGLSEGTTTITVSFVPNDTDNYNNATSKKVVVTVTEPVATTVKVDKPTANSHCKSGLVYNGSNQILTNAADTGYTFTNNNRTNAGSQTVIATLSSGYIWSDNTTGVQTFSCSIERATPNLTVALDEITLFVDDTSNPRYEYNGDGELSCSTDSVASCEVKDGKLFITAKSIGSTDITVTATQGVNYKAASETIEVVVTDKTSGEEEPEEKTFTATFNENGGTLKGNSTKSCNTTGDSCGIIDLPTATRNGYTFKGWGTLNTCDSGETSSITLDKNTTYYACWLKNANIPDVDDEGNVEDNVQTGNVVIMLVLCLGLLVIGYAYYYFKSIKQK